MPHRFKRAKCGKQAVVFALQDDGTGVWRCADHIPTDEIDPAPPKANPKHRN